ncbi:TolC family outer membrane protein [Paraburkholderia xenovorans]|jgi:outer membrane protein
MRWNDDWAYTYPSGVRRQAERLLSAGVLALSMLHATAHAASLSELAGEALAHDATFASAEASYRAGLEKEPEARAALLPHIGLTQSDFRNAIHVPGQPAAPYSTVGMSLSYNQSLFRWDDWQAYQESRLLVVGAGFTFASAKQDVLLRVAQAYLDALAAKDGFLLAQEHLRSVDEQLGLTRRSFALGAATVVDMDEARAASDSAHADLVKAQGEVARRYAALQKIVGHPVDAVAPVDADATLAAFADSSSDTWEADAQTSGLDVRQQQIALEVAKREVSKVNAGYMPSVSIVGNASNGNAAFINGQTNFYTGAHRASSGEIGIQISIPLFDGLSTLSKKREALGLKDKAEGDLEEARRSAALDAQQAFIGVREGVAQIAALRTAQQSAETALKSNRKGFRAGVRINADVLDAEDKLFRARRDLARARYDALMQLLHLKASVAQLDESALAQLDAPDASRAAPSQK